MQPKRSRSWMLQSSNPPKTNLASASNPSENHQQTHRINLSIPTKPRSMLYPAAIEASTIATYIPNASRQPPLSLASPSQQLSTFQSSAIQCTSYPSPSIVSARSHHPVNSHKDDNAPNTTQMSHLASISKPQINLNPGNIAFSEKSNAMVRINSKSVMSSPTYDLPPPTQKYQHNQNQARQQIHQNFMNNKLSESYIQDSNIEDNNSKVSSNVTKNQFSISSENEFEMSDLDESDIIELENKTSQYMSQVDTMHVSATTIAPGPFAGARLLDVNADIPLSPPPFDHGNTNGNINNILSQSQNIQSNNTFAYKQQFQQQNEIKQPSQKQVHNQTPSQAHPSLSDYPNAKTLNLLSATMESIQSIKSYAIPEVEHPESNLSKRQDQLQTPSAGPGQSGINTTLINRRPDAFTLNELYYAKREVEKLQREIVQSKLQNERLENDMLVKSGEISMIRKNLNKLSTENSALKDDLIKQRVISEQSKDSMRASLQVQLERVKTEMSFKEQELLALQLNTRRSRPSSYSQNTSFTPSAAARHHGQFPTMASFNEPLPIHKPQITKVSTAINTDPVPDPKPRIIERIVTVSARSNSSIHTDYTRIVFGKCMMDHQLNLLEWGTQRQQQRAIHALLAVVQDLMTDSSSNALLLLPHIQGLLEYCIEWEQNTCLLDLLEILRATVGISRSCRLVVLSSSEFSTVLFSIFQTMTSGDNGWLAGEALALVQTSLLKIFIDLSFEADTESIYKFEDMITSNGIGKLFLTTVPTHVTILATHLCCLLCKNESFVQNLSVIAAPSNDGSSTTALSTTGSTSGVSTGTSCINHICSLLTNPLDSTTREDSNQLRHTILTFCMISMETNPQNSQIFGIYSNLSSFVEYMHGLVQEYVVHLNSSLDHVDLPMAKNTHACSSRELLKSNLSYRLSTAVKFIHRLFGLGTTLFGISHAEHQLVTSLAEVATRPGFEDEVSDLAKDLLYSVAENPEPALVEIWGNDAALMTEPCEEGMGVK
ncbi:hypothetical protein BDV3_001462 [Batrachochytrium dendrobatidis]|uniref:Uncharacterized protein n=1 Tax=Batrachochytrium dendrobatidis (strain JEL423) TaxID=403673 RepID=A0A177WAX7_BATDL|nr:hypothetical protein O5D80_004266 [Batrachochytrium dendrobatidis]KAK5668374.1 hypothetical protein QVD99_005399 [Batrachochytrium dendrobatidis]OAJ36885.1 hypothetical protein BDEG_20995 [Batrachochytrium dendrobatidis JEL423]